MKKPEPRYYTQEAKQSLTEKFGWPYKDWMQDWPLEISDEIKIDECIQEYGRLNNSDEKFLLMQAILYALDKLQVEKDFEYYSAQVFRFLNTDFELHKFTIYYWTLYEDPEIDGTVSEWIFRITPLTRRVWDEHSK